MMLERADLKRLRIPFAIAMLLASVGIATLVFVEKKVDVAKLQRKAGLDRMEAAKSRLAKAADEEQEIRGNLVKFKQFADRGMTGEEKRLEWIETLAAIRQQRRVFEVRYLLERQRPVDFPGIKSAEAIFAASRLKLELLVLHEGDLLNFLSDLVANPHSFVALRSCSISRIEGATGGGGPLRPRLRADCTADMITLKGADKAT